jgi:hypothetical protein
LQKEIGRRESAEAKRLASEARAIRKQAKEVANSRQELENTQSKKNAEKTAQIKKFNFYRLLAEQGIDPENKTGKPTPITNLFTGIANIVSGQPNLSISPTTPNQSIEILTTTADVAQTMGSIAARTLKGKPEDALAAANSAAQNALASDSRLKKNAAPPTYDVGFYNGVKPSKETVQADSKNEEDKEAKSEHAKRPEDAEKDEEKVADAIAKKVIEKLSAKNEKRAEDQNTKKPDALEDFYNQEKKK